MSPRERSHKTRICRGVTYPESYITKYTSMRRKIAVESDLDRAGAARQSGRRSERLPPWFEADGSGFKAEGLVLSVEC